METNNQFLKQELYKRAEKRVKQIKGFYSHLIVYVFVNLIIVVININNLEPGESYFQWHNFITLSFWGIGLLAHAASVFLPSFILGQNWEERKIKQIMDKENKSWE